MKKLFLMALLASATLSFGQTSSSIIPDGGGNNGSDLQNINNRSGFWINSVTAGNNLSGTFYIYDNWINRAEVHDINGKGYNIPNCNFNVKFNRIEALLDNENKERVFAFNTREITKVRIGLKTFVNKSIVNKPSYLLEVIQEGEKLALYKSYGTKTIEATYNPMTQAKQGKDKIEIVSTYYVEKDGKVEEFTPKKSTILKLMANQKDEIKSFIKENKLSVKNETDLFKIFKHYNTI